MPLRRILRLAPWPVRRRVLAAVRVHVLPRVAPARRLRLARQIVPLVPTPTRATRQDDDASPASVRRDNVDRVVTALDAAGVDWFRVPAKSFTHTAVAVPEKARDLVLDLLEGLTAGGDGLLETVVGQKRRRAGVLRLSWPVTDSQGYLELGAEFGCEVEFWAERDGNLVGPRSNPVADVVPAGEPAVTAPEWVLSEFASPRDTARYRTRAIFTLGSPERVNFPIDVVYTWVDGSDPAWLERKHRALGDNSWVAEVNEQTANNSRFASRDELRYSMRALHSYAPWIRRIVVKPSVTVTSQDPRSPV